MIKAKDTDRHLREAILNLLAYCAVFQLALSDEEILWYIPVKASSVGVRSHLRKLQKRGKIKQLKGGKFGIKSIKYPSQFTRQQNIDQQMKKAKHWSYLFRLLPSVKAVIVSSDDLVRSTDSHSNAHYIFITLPNRIYITKGSLYYLLGLMRKRRNASNNEDCLYLDTFYTTAGLRFVENMGTDELSQTLWFILAQPVYGKQTWDLLIKNNPSLYKRLPNYPWQHHKSKIFSSFSQRLDKLDNSGYRKHLRHIADQSEFQDKKALLRIRPDALIARPSHNDKLAKIKSNYKDIYSHL